MPKVWIIGQAPSQALVMRARWTVGEVGVPVLPVLPALHPRAGCLAGLGQVAVVRAVNGGDRLRAAPGRPDGVVSPQYGDVTRVPTFK